MIEKDTQYWELHKEIYWKRLIELDEQVQRYITSRPNSVEGKMLEHRVNAEVQERLKRQIEV